MRWYVWLNLLLYNILMLLVIQIKRRFIDKGKICQEREQGTHYRSQAHHKMQTFDVLILLSVPQMALPQGRRNSSLENI
jgi:hypothetical protein